MRLLTVALGVLLATACAVGTEDVDDDQIWGNFSAVSGDGETVDASVSLFLGVPLSFTWVRLADEDVLTVTDGGDPVEMERRSFLGITSYEASFDAAVPGTEYTFDLYIAEEDADYVAVASLPEPFVLTAPQGGTFSRSQDAIDVAWSESSTDAMSVHVDVTCGQHVQVFDFPVTGDTGTFAIPAGGIAPVDENGAAIEGTCDAWLAVWRRRAGEAPDAFLYGSTVGAQVRGVSIVLEP